MENEKMINVVQIENKQFREDAANAVKEFIDTGNEAGKPEGGIAMGMSALLFAERMRKALFGDNDVATFTEEMFDNAVESATTSLIEESKEKGKSPAAALLISLTGMTLAAKLCCKYFPKEGESNG